MADSGNRRLQRLSTEGALLRIIDLTYEAPQAPPQPTHLGIDAAGLLYALDAANARVLKVTPDGQVVASYGLDPVEPRTAELFGPTIVEENIRLRLDAHAVGDQYLYLYGVAHGSNPHNLFPVRPQLKRIDLRTGGSTQLNPAVLDPIIEGRPVARPFGMAVDRDGYLYVTESSPYGGAIRKLTPDGELVTQWVGRYGEDEPRQIGWITVGADDNLYVSGHGGYSILAYARDGQFLGRWQASLANGIAVDRAGTIYTATPGWADAGQIAVLAPTGETVARVGAPANAPGLLSSLSTFDLDADGNVVAITRPQHGQLVLHRFTPAGQLLGTREVVSPSIDRNYDVRLLRLAPDSSFFALTPQYGEQQPRGLLRFTEQGDIVQWWSPAVVSDRHGPTAQAYTVTPDQTAYVAYEDRVLKIGPDGRQLAEWRAEDIDRWAPRGRNFTANTLALDGDGNLYVGGRWYIYKLSPDGLVLARWGDAPTGDDERQLTLFSGITSLVVEESGNIYVGHSGRDPLKMLRPDGSVLAALSLPDTQPWRNSYAAPAGGALRIDRQGNVYLASGSMIWRLACES